MKIGEIIEKFLIDVLRFVLKLLQYRLVKYLLAILSVILTIYALKCVHPDPIDVGIFFELEKQDWVNGFILANF